MPKEAVSFLCSKSLETVCSTDNCTKKGKKHAFNQQAFSFVFLETKQVRKAVKRKGYSQYVCLGWDVGDGFQHQMHASHRSPEAQAATGAGTGETKQEEKAQKA